MLKDFNNGYDINAGIYFKDITKTAPLTRLEEKNLSNRWRNKKDIKARNKLVESNLKFAITDEKYMELTPQDTLKLNLI